MTAAGDMMHAHDQCCLASADSKRQTQPAASRGPKKCEPSLPCSLHHMFGMQLLTMLAKTDAVSALTSAFA